MVKSIIEIEGLFFSDKVECIEKHGGGTFKSYAISYLYFTENKVFSFALGEVNNILAKKVVSEGDKSKLTQGEFTINSGRSFNFYLVYTNNERKEFTATIELNKTINVCQNATGLTKVYYKADDV